MNWACPNAEPFANYPIGHRGTRLCVRCSDRLTELAIGEFSSIGFSNQDPNRHQFAKDVMSVSPEQGPMHEDRWTVHTPLSIRQALRLGTMTDADARKLLVAWGESEGDIQSALNSGGWSWSTGSRPPRRPR